MALLIGFFLLSIIFSFLCSVWEAVLLSITPSYIKRKEQETPATGKLIAGLKDDIDKPLSAILTLNTIAHTVGAIGVGAQAGKLFGENNINILGFQLTYASLIAAFMTLAILFLSEIIPKTIGANNWRTLAPLTARAIRVLMWILKPFVWLSTLITRWLQQDKEKSVFSRQDFAAITEVANESGAFKENDYTLIKNVLHFDELTAEDVMTPRTVMMMAEENQTVKSFYDKHQPIQFSRIPLYHESKDVVTGLLLKDEMLLKLVEGKPDELLKNISREVSIIGSNMSLRQVFETLSEKREKLAVVVDKYGGLMGMVTLEDVFETLFGLEIMDETDEVSDLQSYARQKWETRAKKLGLIE